MTTQVAQGLCSADRTRDIRPLKPCVCRCTSRLPGPFAPWDTPSATPRCSRASCRQYQRRGSGVAARCLTGLKCRGRSAWSTATACAPPRLIFCGGRSRPVQFGTVAARECLPRESKEQPVGSVDLARRGFGYLRGRSCLGPVIASNRTHCITPVEETERPAMRANARRTVPGHGVASQASLSPSSAADNCSKGCLDYS
jgi:hypothetical protein